MSDVMSSKRLLERLEFTAIDDKHAMFSLADDAICSLIATEAALEDGIRIKPHLFQLMIGELEAAVAKYGASQQLRTHMVKVVSKYIAPDHAHTRPKQ